jgi:hypothetical protein
MSDQVHLRWPPERFFWAVVEAPAWRGGRSGLLPPGLLVEAADGLPVPIEDLQVVGAACGDGRVVICAARRDEVAAVDAGAVSLTPETLPGCVEADADPSALDLLVGEFEPLVMRRARLRRHAGLAATIVACATLAAIGLGRRADHWDGIATSAREARLELAARAAPGVAPDRLALEVARLRSAAAGGRPPRDAALTLASLLDAWPRAAAATPQSIVVGDSGVSVSVSVEGEPSAFLGALRPPEGWTLDDPRLNAAGGVTRLTLQMRPVKEDPP